jgi:hypothetical protein
LISRLERKTAAELPQPVALKSATIPFVGFTYTETIDTWLRMMIDCGLRSEGQIKTHSISRAEGWSAGGETILSRLRRKGIRILVSDWLWYRATLGYKKLPMGIQRQLTTEWEENGWRLIRIGNCPPSEYPFKEFAKRSANGAFGSTVAEIYIDTTKKTEASPLAAKWMEILKHSEIPYNLKLRREKFNYAFNDLSNYVRAYEAAKTHVALK